MLRWTHGRCFIHRRIPLYPVALILLCQLWSHWQINAKRTTSSLYYCQLQMQFAIIDQMVPTFYRSLSGWWHWFHIKTNQHKQKFSCLTRAKWSVNVLALRHEVFLCFLSSCAFLGQTHGGSDTKCPVTVKILDAVKGTPAGPMALNLYQRTADGGWTQVANGYQLIN